MTWGSAMDGYKGAEGLGAAAVWCSVLWTLHTIDALMLQLRHCSCSRVTQTIAV